MATQRNLRRFFRFIEERYTIYENRRTGLPKPWTKDPILQQYRFCNVYRELDKVTIFIRKFWREPYGHEPDIWFGMVVARLINLPDALETLLVPLPWDEKRFRSLMRERKLSGRKCFSPAYMIRADAGTPGTLKTDYLARRVLTPLWKDRADIRPHEGDKLETFFNRLRAYRDMGPFIAGQIVADTKFTFPLKNALDWWTWATPGPGSLRGLNRVCGWPVKESWQDGPVNHWFPTLQGLQLNIDPLIKEANMPRLSAQDLQNCLCEFDKYERVRLGEGRPKQRFNGV